MRIVAIAAGVLAGLCLTTAAHAKPKPLSADISGETVVLTARPLPEFSAMTSAKVHAHIAGAFMMIRHGNRVVAENGIEDPAIAMGAELAQALVVNRGATLVEAPLSTTSQNPKEIAAVAGESRYVLDVATVYWGYLYQPFDWKLYNVMYTSKLRIIDTKTQKVIAEDFCKWRPAKDYPLPDGERLLANQAAKVKAQLNMAREACTAQFKQTVLGGLQSKP